MTVSVKSRILPIKRSVQVRNTKQSSPVDSRATTEAKFDESVAARTRQSLSGVRRAKKIAEAFTIDQLIVFTEMEVNQTDMLYISKIRDESRRGEVVNLIASGMNVYDAIAEVKKSQGSSGTGVQATSVVKAPKEVQPARPAVDSDDEWFEQYCGRYAAKLKNPEKFKSDVILFRSIYEYLPIFRIKSNRKKFMAIAANAHGGGVLEFLLDSFVSRIDFLSVAPPHKWPICRKCKGQGENTSGQKCQSCSGGGYHLSFLEPS